jgi:hypothetical protein
MRDEIALHNQIEAMPISSKLLAGVCAFHRIRDSRGIPEGILLTLAKELTTTGPDCRTYPKGSTGHMRKPYRNGVILEMEDGRKIPVRMDFLELSATIAQVSTATLIPYATSP